jgi:competence protein ComEC
VADHAAADTALATPTRAESGWTWSRPLAVVIDRLEAEQDRWFLWLPVLYGVGIAAYFALLREPPLWAALSPLAAALALRLAWRGGTPAILLTGWAVAATLGFAAAKLRTEWVASPMLERRIGPVEVRGFLELVEPRARRGERLTVRVISIRGLAAKETPRRVRVRLGRIVPGLAPGQAVRFSAVLSPPTVPALPGDYDFARAAYFAGIGGVGYALSPPQADAAAGPAPLRLEIEAVIAGLRHLIGRRITAALTGEHGAIANALITGERGGISEATNDAFRDSGLFHILSISGLHMTIMAGAVFLAVRFMLAAVPAIALRFPIKKAAAVAAAAAALAYLLISGGSFATVRSWIMISIMFLAVLLDRPAVTMRNVALGALAIMALVPESLFDVGFQMSFAAVLALVASYEAIRGRSEQREDGRSAGMVRDTLLFFGGIVLATLVASAAVAPFAAYHFHKSQQYAVLANLIAIPVCNVIVLPAALATLMLMPLGLEAGPLWVMGQGIGIMLWCAEAVAGIPGAVARIPAIPTASFGLMVGGGLWLCLWRTRWRLLGLAVLASGIGLAPTLSHPDILVGRDGDLVAVRSSASALSAIARSGTAFELQRWLEHDGDARSPHSAAKGEAFRCDPAGCTAKIKGIVVAVARHPAALADDCALADVLVLRFPRPKGCRSEGTVIDFFELRRKGTHAIYLQEGSMRIMTVADARGERPWTQSSLRPPRRTQPALPSSAQPTSGARTAAGLIEAGTQSEDFKPADREDEEPQ